MDFLFKRFNVLSLNVRGIRDLTKRKALFLFCKRSDADLILLQETHSCDSDTRFWKAQWGNIVHFSHGSNHSAGVSILVHGFKGDILEVVPSSDGRWIIIIVKQDNTVFVVCNVYGFNSHFDNKNLFNTITGKLRDLRGKYVNAFIILAGDFNEYPDEIEDRYPPRAARSSQGSDLISSLCSELSLTDAWRFFNPGIQDFTWSNRSLTLKSRIDLFLISSSALQFVNEVKHVYAPLSDHNLIILKLGSIDPQSGIRGYWKFNNTLLSDDSFNESVKLLANEIFEIDINNGHKKKWEYFKYKIRQLAIKRSKEIKKEKYKSEHVLMNKLTQLMSKRNINREEEIELKAIQIQIDQIYTEMAKGAFIRSRAKWLEEGEKNTNYFFALEKRNAKRNSVTELYIDGTLSKDLIHISKFVSSFYGNLYQSNFNREESVRFFEKIQHSIPIISEDYKASCDTDISLDEVKNALFAMKKGKSPGIDGLGAEFYIHFWELIQLPLMHMFRECIDQGEMTTTMKQGIISLIPKPGKDPHLIDNWRPITLLTIDYKILASVYANRLKSDLNSIIAETQTGFMKNCHISNNIRLVLDLLDYADNVDSDAFVLFLDFYKAFDTIEHPFLIQAIKAFGFGSPFINIVSMFYKDINSSVIINQNTSPRFQINRGVRQECNISPFLFILVTELLAIHLVKEAHFEGIKIFGKEIKISQLADDTTIFLNNKDQLSVVFELVEKFSYASGLRLNRSKCELLPLHCCSDSAIDNIPVKQNVKYLGIHVCKNIIVRQNLNFSNRIQKTKSIFNCWLQRDLSVLGRVLLSKAEGLSRFVYPSLSLFVKDSTANQVNKTFLDFIWKNKSHRLKKNVLSNPKEKGGLEILDFIDVVNTFKINWLKRCIRNPDSIFFFIPNFIFNKLGGLSFLLKCNFLPNKLPIKLSNFHQQSLLAWRLSFNHNFSPHKSLLWNNSDILIRNKSVFFPKWFDRGINHVLCLFDDSGTMLSYEQFMEAHDFPIPFKDFKAITDAIPSGIRQLIKNHLSYGNKDIRQPSLMLDGVELSDKKCNNKHIRQHLQKSNSIAPRGMFIGIP